MEPSADHEAGDLLGCPQIGVGLMEGRDKAHIALWTVTGVVWLVAVPGVSAPIGWLTYMLGNYRATAVVKGESDDVRGATNPAKRIISPFGSIPGCTAFAPTPLAESWLRAASD